MDYCSSPDVILNILTCMTYRLIIYLPLQDFTDFLKFHRKHLGQEVVEKGAFILSLMEVDGCQKTLGPTLETWLSLVKPEVTITMDILVSGSRDDDTDSRRPQCSTFIHIARATIDNVGVEEVEENDPADTLPPPRKTGPPGPDDNLPEDIDDSDSFRYSRRFRITLKAIKNITTGMNILDEALATHNFVTELYQMLDEPKNAPSIAWTELGTSFVVFDVGVFNHTTLHSHSELKTPQLRASAQVAQISPEKPDLARGAKARAQ
ncbi:hypothetical protein DXG01_012381 [Tephrocybe rancida]|nr:hypothetical protein DXG01_012381 [Tephrocybe rancida]